MKVYSTAYKNLVANMSTIKTDVDTLKHDFDHQDYYGASDMATSIAKIALPVPASLGDTKCYDGFTLTTVEVADFLSGFIHGFTGNDHKAYFETCFHDTDAFEVDVCTAVRDFASKDNEKVLEGVKLIMGDLPELNTYLAGCPDASADIATTANWFTYWKSQGEMKVYSTAYKNLVANMGTIKTDANTLETDFDNADYYGAADMAAEMAKIALPVPTSTI